jgi:chondroitin-sulfate-ABC endolyase/exolyase
MLIFVFIINTLKEYLMKSYIKLSLFVAVLFLSQAVVAQIFSFENKRVPSNWHLQKGKLKCSSKKYKEGKHALALYWKANDQLVIRENQLLRKVSRKKKGGITTWIYNEKAINDSLIFSFKNSNGKEVCRHLFYLNFKGWRAFWAKFIDDMKMPRNEDVASVELLFPNDPKGGVLYLDLLEFTPKVPWTNMSDAQYHVNRTDFSLIQDFVKYRNTVPKVDPLIVATEQEMGVIHSRLEKWCLGGFGDLSSSWYHKRKQAEKNFIAKGVKRAQKIKMKYDETLAPIGYPLFSIRGGINVNGRKGKEFRTVNELMLLPLALDYRKNHSKESLAKVKFIYDWFNDQGWADGSGLGTLCLEKLRSSGYFYSLFLVKDALSPERLQRELNTLNWFTMFGDCYELNPYGGEVADNLRALAVPKLIYALSLPDMKEREIAMTAYKRYIDQALAIAPGYFGVFKPDYSGYHHRGPYHSAYYPHALYVGALIGYLLHDTPYALASQTMEHIKKGLLAFRFMCAELEVPAGTVGRFPYKQKVLHELLPAFAYAALSYDTPDKKLIGALKKVMQLDKANDIEEYIKTVDSNLNYTSTVGEVQLMNEALHVEFPVEPAVKGAKFLPYSGVLIAKDSQYQFNVKGFSRYIWDFESSATQNLSGRYLAYGQLEYFDFKQGRKSYNPSQPFFDWNYIPGTTTIVLPQALLKDKKRGKYAHRTFSDESFLAGVTVNEGLALFSVKLHANNYPSALKAYKSVFVFDDYLLCMGSNIESKEESYETVTTLYQDFNLPFTPIKINKNTTLCKDASMLYLVPQGKIDFVQEKNYSRACINHGVAPKQGKYLYYMIKNRDKKVMKRLMNKDEIEVIMQNKAAHIVRNRQKNILCGALFDANQSYDLLVKKVNIPLAYILKKKGDIYLLAICEPDMRRASKPHMGALTREDVIDPSKPFETRIVLEGRFNVEMPNESIKVVYNAVANETVVSLQTIDAQNYKLTLKPVR